MAAKLQPCQPFLSGYHRPNTHALLIFVWTVSISYRAL
jgi:hypothetical protein